MININPRVPNLAEIRRKMLEEIEKIPVLRNGSKLVGVWQMAEQYFCEAKVEMEIRHGEVETEEKQKGKDLHGLLLEEVPLSQEEFEKRVMSRLPSSFTLRLGAIVNGLPIIGTPDAVVFQGGMPRCVFELKSSKKSREPYLDEKVQAQLYGLLLEEAGFACSNLVLSIAVMTRDLEAKSEGLKNLLPVLTVEYILTSKKLSFEIRKEDLLSLSKVRSGELKAVLDLMSSGSLRLFLFPYSRKDAISYVSRSRDYWFGLRPPLYAARSETKCKFCSYARLCEFSLIKP